MEELNKIYDELNSLFEEFKINHEKFSVKGNKSAGAKARKNIQAIKKIITSYKQTSTLTAKELKK